jgi:HAD superfamily hydrolase (TIGR01509 family)
MTLVKAVFLDIDGTLMDTNYLHIEAWAQAFEEIGARLPRSRIHHEVGKGSEKLITEFVEDDQKAERVSELHSEYYAKLQERGHPLPGANELIASLVERGYEVWLATSAEPEELEHHMEELGAEDNIAGIVSSDEAEESKPAPDIFGLALERAGVSPEDAAVVGDSIWDIEEAGVRAAAVMTGGAFSRAELEEAGAYAVYEDCQELLNDDFPEQLEPNDS